MADLSRLPEMHSVESTRVAMAGYDSAKKVLYATFPNGRTWQYPNVPKDGATPSWEEWRKTWDGTAELSAGVYFSKYIANLPGNAEVL